MKKLKFLALGLVAAFGFAACGENDDPQETDLYNYSAAEEVFMGGASSAYGSFYTFSNGAQTKAQLTENAAEANVVFCFSTLTDQISFISGSEATNEIVKEACKNSVTKFVEIGSAEPKKFEKADFSNATTSFAIDKKVLNGKNAVAFKNAKCQGFFEIVSFDETKTDLTLKVWIATEKPEVAE